MPYCQFGQCQIDVKGKYCYEHTCTHSDCMESVVSENERLCSNHKYEKAIDEYSAVLASLTGVECGLQSIQKAKEFFTEEKMPARFHSSIQEINYLRQVLLNLSLVKFPKHD